MDKEIHEEMKGKKGGVKCWGDEFEENMVGCISLVNPPAAAPTRLQS